MENEVKRNGFIYSKGTKAGFMRMRRQGIPLPPFRIENKLTKQIANIYSDMITRVIGDFIIEVQKANGVIQNGTIVTDANNIKDIINEANKNGLKAPIDPIINRSALISATSALETRWQDGNPEEIAEADLREKTINSMIAGSFLEVQNDFFKQFFDDAPDQVIDIVRSFSLDKQKVFEDRLENLRTIFLDDCKERLRGQESDIRKKFLQDLIDYAEGRKDSLDIEGTINELKAYGDKRARFFARDTMAKFNKANALAVYTSAGVRTVKWITCNDRRVRPSHSALNNRVFSLEDLPEELNDFNCRCGLIPADFD